MKDIKEFLKIVDSYKDNHCHMINTVHEIQLDDKEGFTEKTLTIEVSHEGYIYYIGLVDEETGKKLFESTPSTVDMIATQLIGGEKPIVDIDGFSCS